ncbi:hypothetical protein FRC08_012476 [Ceratobasidium sp. 394]|nr:hypothetical protein FRC08_012476 [Ceratobasidium sp. 394]
MLISHKRPSLSHPPTASFNAADSTPNLHTPRPNLSARENHQLLANLPASPLRWLCICVDSLRLLRARRPVLYHAPTLVCARPPTRVVTPLPATHSMCFRTPSSSNLSVHTQTPYPHFVSARSPSLTFPRLRLRLVSERMGGAPALDVRVRAMGVARSPSLTPLACIGIGVLVPGAVAPAPCLPQHKYSTCTPRPNPSQPPRHSNNLCAHLRLRTVGRLPRPRLHSLTRSETSRAYRPCAPERLLARAPLFARLVSLAGVE